MFDTDHQRIGSLARHHDNIEVYPELTERREGSAEDNRKSGQDCSQQDLAVRELEFPSVLSDCLYADNAPECVRTLPIGKRRSHGTIDGYIKVRLKGSDDSKQHVGNDVESGAIPRYADRSALLSPQLPRSPDAFGLGFKLEKSDYKLWKFYVTAWCPGRTILPGTNSWKKDLAPMLPVDEALRSALLALAGVYVLDYSPDEQLRIMINHHYSKAVRLLHQTLDREEEQQIGKGDAAVGTITLLNMLDVVRWEDRRSKHLVPRWLEGARQGADWLDRTDPGTRYYHSRNVQVTTARVSNTIVIGRAAILVLTMLPLDISNTSGNKFSWLGHGTERESRMIHGGCGFSAKLLHIFAQITHCAAVLDLDPDSFVYNSVAHELGAGLSALRQWSERSDGYESPEAFLTYCKLNAEGVVFEGGAMTDLTAEAWRVAAQIYLQCRVFRLSRRHPIVRQLIDLLARLIRIMPCQGSLFTAQAPFMPVFLLGLIAVEPRHRVVATQWFETVLGSSDCRSSVEPAWGALQRLRSWVDESFDELSELSSSIILPAHADARSQGSSAGQLSMLEFLPLARRRPWWERLVAHILASEGTLCLI